MIKDEALKVSHYKPLSIVSPAFNNGEAIPSKYTCDGENVMPLLAIEDIPDEAKSLTLIIDDPDAPSKTWVHYIAWNIPVTTQIENEKIGIEGVNDFHQHSYGGPCPPRGRHRYFFKVYALDNLLELPTDTTKPELEKSMAGHILAFGELMGVYERKKT